MEEWHQRRHVAMRGDEPVIDILGMRGRIAQAGDAWYRGERADQLAQSPRSAFGGCAVIGIDVLTQEGDLARPGGGKPACLGDDLRRWAGVLRAPRIGHDAEGAELVAALLDREERA